MGDSDAVEAVYGVQEVVQQRNDCTVSGHDKVERDARETISTRVCGSSLPSRSVSVCLRCSLTHIHHTYRRMAVWGRREPCS